MIYHLDNVSAILLSTPKIWITCSSMSYLAASIMMFRAIAAKVIS